MLCFLVERVAGIVGGSLVEYPRKYPFMAALVDDSGKLTCGATLITHNWLVTSARCVVNVDTLEMLPNPRVILGAHNFSSPLDVEVCFPPFSAAFPPRKKTKQKHTQKKQLLSPSQVFGLVG